MATFKEKEYQCECEECDVIITYTKSDIKDNVVHNLLGGYFRQSYILCPNCGKRIILEDHDEYENEDAYDEECNIDNEEYTLEDYVNDMFGGNWELYHDNMDDD